MNNMRTDSAISRVIATALVMILVVSLVFAPAVTARAEGTGSSAELKINMDGVEISGKAYADPTDMVFALMAGMGSNGETMLDGAVYVTAQSLILESASILGQAYGVDLTNYTENLKNSVLAPDSGSAYALDEETFAMLSGGIQTQITSSIDLDSIDLEAISALAEALAQHTAGLGDILMDSAEINVAPQTMSLIDGDIAVSKMTLTFGPEALGKIAAQFTDSVAQDESLKPMMGEVYDMLAATGKLNISPELEGMTGAEVMEQVWQVLPQLSEALPSALEENGIYLSVSATTTKETNEVVAAGVDLTIQDETMSVDLTFADGNYGVDMYVPGSGYMSAWVIVSQNDEEGFSVFCYMSTDEESILSLGFMLDKTTGDYAVFVNDTMLEGTVTTDDDATVITLDSIDGEPAGDISLTLRSGDSVSVPEFTEMLTMSEEEITEVVNLVMSVVNSLTGSADAA